MAVIGQTTRIRDVYHVLRPHPALSPVVHDDDPAEILEQQQHEREYCQLLAQGILAVILPIEDLRNPCLRSLVSDIVADSILGSILLHRLCESAFVFDSIKKACETVQSRLETRVWALDSVEVPEQRLERFGLLTPALHANHNKATPIDLTDWFWMIVQYTLLAVNALWSLAHMLLASSTTPERRGSGFVSTTGLRHPSAQPNDETRHQTPPMRAMIDYGAWPAIGTLFSLPTRMPWLTGLLSLTHRLLLNGRGRIGSTNGRLDRYVAQKKPCRDSHFVQASGCAFEQRWELEVTVFDACVVPRCLTMSCIKRHLGRYVERSVQPPVDVVINVTKRKASFCSGPSGSFGLWRMIQGSR